MPFGAGSKSKTTFGPSGKSKKGARNLLWPAMVAGQPKKPEKEKELSFMEKWVIPTVSKIGLDVATTLGTHYLTKGVDKLITGSADERRNVWQAYSTDMTASNLAANNRAKDFAERDRQWRADGLNNDQIYRRALRSSIAEELTAKIMKGQVPVGAGKLTPEAMQPGSEEFEFLVTQIENDRINADNGAYKKSYNNLLELSQTRPNESATERYARLARHHKGADSIFGQAFNYIRGKSKEDIRAESIDSLKQSEVYGKNLALSEAFANWDVTRGENEANSAVTEAVIAKHANTIDESVFEKTHLLNGQQTAYVDGKWMTTRGYWEQTTNTLTGEETRTFKPLGDSVPSNEKNVQFNSMFGKLGQDLVSIQSGKAYVAKTGETFVSELYEKYGDIDIYNLQSLIGTSGYEGEAGFNKLVDIATQVQKDIYKFRTDKNNFMSTLSQENRDALAKYYVKDQNDVDAYRTALVKSDMLYTPEQLTTLVNDFSRKRAEHRIVEVGLNAGVIDLAQNEDTEKMEAIALNHRFDSLGAMEPDPSKQLMIGEYHINKLQYEAWTRGNELSPQEKTDELEKLGDLANKPMFTKDEEYTDAAADYGKLATSDAGTVPEGAVPEGAVPEDIKTEDDAAKFTEKDQEDFDNLTLEDYDKKYKHILNMGEQGGPKKSLSKSFAAVKSMKEELGVISMRRHIVEPLGLNVLKPEDSEKAIAMHAKLEEWYEDNFNKLATAAATNPMVHDLFKKKGILGLIEKFYEDEAQ